MIRTANVISIDSAPDEVGLFDKVTVYYEETGDCEDLILSTMTRLDLQNGVICKDSSFGKAIMGKKVNDRVLIKASDEYSYYVVIKKIVKGKDDETIPLTEY